MWLDAKAVIDKLGISNIAQTSAKVRTGLTCLKGLFIALLLLVK